MNYLLSLSFTAGKKEMMLGCLIAETGRSTRLSNFDYEVQRGIDLHLEIRKFLENHPIASKNTKRLPFLYQKHNMEILETYMDHFTALEWAHINPAQPIDECIEMVYNLPENRIELMHSKLKKVFHRMKQHQWLKQHHSINGLSRFLTDYIEYGFCRINFAHTVPVLIENYEELKNDFAVFYKDLHLHLSENYQELISKEELVAQI